MVTKSNAWWMTKTKGIYIFRSSPFRQRALAGFGTEISSLIRQHWPGAIYAASLAFGTWYTINWAESYYHKSIRKDSDFFNQEAQQLGSSKNEI